MLVLARLGLWLIPFGALRRLFAKTHPAPDASTRPDPPAIAWAINATARRLPWMTCLVAALAADALLRRAGWSPELKIGMRRGAGASASIEAHAWVVCDGRVLVGSDATLHEYTPLAPAQDAR
jgi:hypothetical protein